MRSVRLAILIAGGCTFGFVAAAPVHAQTPSTFNVQLLRHGTSVAQWTLTPAPGAEAPFSALKKVTYIGTQTETLVEQKNSAGEVSSVSTVVHSTPASTTVGIHGTLEPVPHQPDLVVADVMSVKLDRLRTFKSGGLELQVPVTRQRVVKQVVTLKNGAGTLALPDDYTLRIAQAPGTSTPR